MPEQLNEKERFVREAIRRIMSGEVLPGFRLPPESELAERYGIAKTNVHLGVKELERLGFLKVVPRHATYVADPKESLTLEGVDAVFRYTDPVTDRRALEALLELREMMGIGVILWMTRHPDRAYFDRVKSQCAAVERAVPEGEGALYQALLGLYRTLYLHTDNAIFPLLVRSFSNSIPLSTARIARYADPDEMLSVYRAIVQHAEKGDTSAAISVWVRWNSALSMKMLSVAFPEK